MTLIVTLALVYEVYLDIGHVVTLPEIVVPDKTVEIDRCVRTDIVLIIFDFRHCPEIRYDILAYPCGLFKRGAFRHVDNNLELALVVKRQHFKLNHLQRNHADRTQQQQSNEHKCNGCFPPALKQRCKCLVIYLVID